MSSLETAEMVKLSNNCHTDLIYSFGNELALIAEQHGLDPLEVIRAANVDYPRPDLAKPGLRRRRLPVEGPVHHDRSARVVRTPFLVGRGPASSTSTCRCTSPERWSTWSAQERGSTEGARLAVLGWAYKGWPPTDDMRGTPIAAMMPVFAAGRDDRARPRPDGHRRRDPPVRRRAGRASTRRSATPTRVLVITDHPDYRAIEVDADARPVERRRFVYDSWRILDESAPCTAAGVALRRPRLRAGAEVRGMNVPRCSAAPASSACTWPAGLSPRATR